MLVLALAVVAEDAPTELKIDRTSIPENCKVTSQKGDRLHMHYVSAARASGYAMFLSAATDWKALDKREQVRLEVVQFSIVTIRTLSCGIPAWIGVRLSL